MPLRKRVIPCLLICEDDLVKTKNFSNSKYLGDPLNTIKIFNQKKADEILILDIEASSKNLPINFDLIRNMATESQMPISYGGGVKNVNDIIKIIELGIEKVVVSSLFFENYKVLKDAIKILGSQSISICLDYRKTKSGFSFYTKNGNYHWPLTFEEILNKISEIEIGEVIFNCIDRDGCQSGMDTDSIEFIRSKIKKIPLCFMGGLSSYDELYKIIEKYDISGIAAGSLFVFTGKLRAVLINYDNLNKDE